MASDSTWNINTELNKAKSDPEANITLVKIIGDRETSVYAAEISPHTHLNPHYHNAGIEIYQIVEGEGEMRIGDNLNNSIYREETFKINSGDFSVLKQEKFISFKIDLINPLSLYSPVLKII